MSDYEYHTGTLKLVPKLENESLEEQCKRLLNNIELPSYFDSYEERFRDDFYKQCVIHNDFIYSAENKEIEPYNDIFVAHQNSDGSIHYEIKYYNGGCSFSEAIETALKNLK